MSVRVALLAVVAALACRGPLKDRPRVAAPPVDAGVTVVRRTPSLATWPCLERCHARRAPNPTQRALTEFHSGKVMRHGPTLTWCDRCHLSQDLDHLRLFDGTPVAFDDAPQLCGQCHAEKFADWARGVHGLQTGSWRAERLRRSCTACHDPHDPHRPHFEALPRPLVRPGDRRSAPP